MSARKRFHGKSTALEVVEGRDLTGYETIVTGSSSGIGVETARALAKAGARVILAVRDVVRGEEVAKQIRQSTGNNKVEVEKLELGSLKSVNEFVKRYLATGRQLNILINNAGIMAGPLKYTEDGFEAQFGTNHMGHFALTVGLIPALKQGYQKTGKYSRVVSLSSCAHILTNILYDDINFKKGNYNEWLAYGQSKTANVLFSVGLTKLYKSEGIVSNSLMPGLIIGNLQKNMTEEAKDSLKASPAFEGHLKNVEQGASTSVWLAVAPELEGVGGRYYENCAQALLKSDEECKASNSGHTGYAVDEENALRLWNISKEWLANPPK